MKSRTFVNKLYRRPLVIGAVFSIVFATPTGFATDIGLFDMPMTLGVQYPVNLLLTPSVEFPTATTYAYRDGTYVATNEYIGYFDPTKCYEYNSGGPYFEPKAIAKGSNHSCSGRWSGNALNFALMSGIDTFRWALSGGYRSIDTASSSNNSSGRGVTVLQRSYQNKAEMSARTIPGPSGNVSVSSSNTGLSFKSGRNTYRAAARVCDDRLGANYLEDNCKAYSTRTGIITYKPEGLIQQYKDNMRFGVFSYLYNEFDNKERDGAVLRSRLKSVGSTNWDGSSNPNHEWSPTTGVYVDNPNPLDASASGVVNSGVINYLNKFGFGSRGYMAYDQPSELIA